MTSLSTGVVLAPQDFVVSATQVSTYELCPRKWAFRYIDGVESPPNKYAELGIDTHGHLEQWLRAAVVPVGSDKSAQLAQALIPFLPPPQIVDPLNVELSQYYTLCGVTFNLAVDLFMPKWGERPRVFDHKTCGDLKWALTADRLPGDVQGSLYAGWALHKMAAPEVDLQWNYVCTKGAIKTLPVVATVTGRQIQERLGKSLESAREMRVIAESGARAMQVQYDARGCSAFGGCPHQERCNLSAQEKMQSIAAQAVAANRGEKNMGDTEAFLASLAATKANGQQQAPAPQQQPMNFGQQQPMQQVQQPMQLAPAQQPVQQQPMNFGQQPQQVQQPVQQYMPQQVVQQPMQYAPQPVQQAPMQIAPAPAPIAAPAQAFVPPQAEAQPKKQRATKSAEDPWTAFASAALPVLIQANQTPDNAAIIAGQYADSLVREHDKRK